MASRSTLENRVFEAGRVPTSPEGLREFAKGLRKVSRNRGHFPDDNAALKLLRLVARDINTTRSGAAGTNTCGWREAFQCL